MGSSNIEWTDETWNPVVGCTPVSPGCLNCYAAAMARRLEGVGRPEYVGLTVTREKGLIGRDMKAFGEGEYCRVVQPKRVLFNGVVRCLEDRLTAPLSWKKPRMVFVNSMSDLFHEDVSFEFIDKVFAVMALCPRHTFQVLTKRPGRMVEYLYYGGPKERSGMVFQAQIDAATKYDLDTTRPGHRYPAEFKKPMQCAWPLPNVWLGTSVEDQARADERIPHLLGCPAAVRFLSCEPLLGEVDLSAFFGGPYVGLPGDKVHENYNFGIDWVIGGGESGPNARPCDVAWLRSLRDQCGAAGVPFFLKQLGAKATCEHLDTPVQQAVSKAIGSTDALCMRCGLRNPPKNRKGGDPTEWPEDLRDCRAFPKCALGLEAGR